MSIRGINHFDPGNGGLRAGYDAVYRLTLWAAHKILVFKLKFNMIEYLKQQLQQCGNSVLNKYGSVLLQSKADRKWRTA